MDELQRMIDRIVAILSGAVDPRSGEVASLNGELVAAVNAANERLRRCEALLQKGYRSEAIQQCELEPNLLDLVASLDFAEFNEWADFVREFEQDAPPELLLEAAAELNEAYIFEQPLEGLMKRHRLFALGRAPMSSRLAVMRQIQEKDPGNPIWKEDTRQFERERLTEIRDAVRQAAQSGDVSALSAIERELRSNDWLEPPPPKLVAQAVKAHTRSRVAAARAEMQEVEQKLTAAFAELDLEAGRHWGNRWYALQQIAELTTDDPLIELVAPALEWLERRDEEDLEEQEHQQAVVDLQRAIETGKPQEEIHRIYHAATKSGRDIPGPLLERCDNYLKYLDDRRRRRFVSLIVGSVAALLVVCVLVGFLVLKQGRENDIATHASNVKTLIENEKLTEAQKYLDRLNDRQWLIEDPRIQTLSANLVSAISQEEDRQNQIRVLEKKIHDLLTLVKPTWTSVKNARDALSNIERLSQSDEQTRVEQARLDISRVESKLQDEVNQNFDRDLNAFLGRVQKLPDDDMAAINALLNELQELKIRPRVSPEKKTGALPGMEARLTGKKNEAKRNEDVSRALAEINKRVGNIPRYKVALTSYVSQFPKSPRSKDFQKVLAEDLVLWGHMRTWDALKDEWSDEDFSRISPKAGKQRVSKLSQIEKETAPVPVPSEFTRLLPAVQAVTRREDESGNGLTKTMLSAMADPTVSDLMMIYTTAGQRIYVKEEPRRLGKKVTFKQYTTMTLSKTVSASISGVSVANSVSDGTFEWLSPQSLFAQYAKRRVNSISSEGWETVYLDLLEKLLADKQMDAIVKTLLLKLILRTACDGSVPLQIVFEKKRKKLDDVTVDPAVNWFDPKDERAGKLRKILATVLGEMESPGKKRESVNQQLAELKKPVMGARSSWVGWLSRNADGRFVMRHDQERGIRRSGTLTVVSVAGTGTVATFSHIGEIRNGDVSIDQPDSKSSSHPYVEGRAIFVEHSPRSR
jgi:hypothetical protein